jgi:hypothetical protein
MQDEREALAAHFPQFMAYFADSGSDYHIGVVSTDMSGAPHGGRLHERRGVRWITPDTPDPIEVFTEMTVDMPGSLWSGTEMGRTAAYTALELLADGHNAGFLRDDPAAYLHITVVSDEDDASGKPPIGKKGFVNWMNEVRQLPHRTTWNSIVTMVPENAEESRGEAYIELTHELGGAVWDINGSRWDEILDDLGGLQAPKPTHEFFLSRIPVTQTLDVKVVHDGITQVFEQSVDYGYDASRNSIWFLDWLPPEGAEVLITYEIASD